MPQTSKPVLSVGTGCMTYVLVGGTYAHPASLELVDQIVTYSTLVIHSRDGITQYLTIVGSMGGRVGITKALDK